MNAGSTNGEKQAENKKYMRLVFMKKKRGRPKGTGKFESAFRLRLSEDDYTKLKSISEVTGLSISQTVRALISDYISHFDVKYF